MTGLAPVMPSADTLLLETKTSIPIPKALSFPMPVGTDLSRPLDLSVGDEEAINRSLQQVLPRDTASHASYVRRPGNGKTGPHKIVRKRRIQDTLVQTRQRRSVYSILSLVLVAIVLLGVLVPLGGRACGL